MSINTEDRIVCTTPVDTQQSYIRSAEERAAILAEYKDHQREKCFYCHRSFLVGTPEDPFYGDRAYELNSINFVTYRKDPFFGHIEANSDKRWICQERAWDSDQGF